MSGSLPGLAESLELTGALLGLPGFAAIRPSAKTFRRRQLRQVRAGGRADQPGADHGVVPLRRRGERRRRRAGHVSGGSASAGASDRSGARPPVFRSARRRKDDRSAGACAAQRGPQMATPGRRVRLRTCGGGQWRRGPHRGAAQREPAGRGGPSALFAPIDAGSVIPVGVRRHRGVGRVGGSLFARRARTDPRHIDGEVATRA